LSSLDSGNRHSRASPARQRAACKRQPGGRDATAGIRDPGAHRQAVGASRVASLLDLDPELGRLIGPERYAQARVELLVPVHRRLPGHGPAITTISAATPHRLGLLVLDGVLARDVYLEDVAGTELLGTGDLVQPSAPAGPECLPGHEVLWTVSAECRIAVVDARCAIALARYPEVYAVLLERIDRSAQRLATAQAITALNRVERRLLAMLWHLAERWGHVTSDGVVIPLDVSHRLLGQLVGARRPTVSSAFAELSRQGKVQRRDDGGWLLRGEPTGVPAAGQETVLSRRRLLTDLRSAKHDHAPANEVDVQELEFRLRRLRREAETLQADLTRRVEAVALPRRAATAGSPPPKCLTPSHPRHLSTTETPSDLPGRFTPRRRSPSGARRPAWTPASRAGADR
jgi:hypothetical protein